MREWRSSSPVRGGQRAGLRSRCFGARRSISIAAGDGANVSRLDFGVYSGTHIDASLHFFDDGAGAETLPIEPLLGPAHLLDATSVEKTLDEDAMGTLEIPDGAERVLPTLTVLSWVRDRGARAGPPIGWSACRS
jgi:kynurenine formamidase